MEENIIQQPKKDTGITPLGMLNFRNRKVKFGIKTDDRRRHVYVVGKTGVGKSTLLENMIIADIRAGRGVGVIDPHGELADKILEFIPEERMDDVIYFNPSDMEYPIAFNPMEQVNPEFRHLVASGLMGVFKKIWPDVWSARMEYILNNTLLALLELPGSTLLGILRMYSDPIYRKKIVDNLKDPVIKGFWQTEYAKYTQRLETEAVAAIQNKVGQFVSNPLVRNILGQGQSTINMREIMDTGKIFIANLSKGRMGEDNSALLGSMVITRLQLAAMSRVDIIDESKRRDFFLYVDEFQNFATDSFASILSEARKYRLSLVIAHQYIGQLVRDNNTKVRDAVFGNVGTIITFRVGAADAEFLEKEFMPEFLQADLVNLAKANVYIKLMIDGVASRPFSAETPPPQKLPLISNRDILVENSRNKYATPRKVVDDRIAGEWQTQSEVLIGDKMNRAGERPLRQTLSGAPPERRQQGEFRPRNDFRPSGSDRPQRAYEGEFRLPQGKFMDGEPRDESRPPRQDRPQFAPQGEYRPPRDETVRPRESDRGDHDLNDGFQPLPRKSSSAPLPATPAEPQEYQAPPRSYEPKKRLAERREPPNQEPEKLGFGGASPMSTLNKHVEPQKQEAAPRPAQPTFLRVPQSGAGQRNLHDRLDQLHDRENAPRLDEARPSRPVPSEVRPGGWQPQSRPMPPQVPFRRAEAPRPPSIRQAPFDSTRGRQDVPPVRQAQGVPQRFDRPVPYVPAARELPFEESRPKPRMPAHPKPHPKQEVNIADLRKAISESLGKKPEPENEEGDKA